MTLKLSESLRRHTRKYGYLGFRNILGLFGGKKKSLNLQLYLNLFRFSCFLTISEEAFLVCVVWVDLTFDLGFDHWREWRSSPDSTPTSWDEGATDWSLTSAGSPPETNVSAEVLGETPSPEWAWPCHGNRRHQSPGVRQFYTLLFRILT